MFHDFYGINRWGDNLISVLENGNVGLNNPSDPNAVPADLAEIIYKLGRRGIQTPLLLRVSNFWNIVSK